MDKGLNCSGFCLHVILLITCSFLQTIHDYFPLFIKLAIIFLMFVSAMHTFSTDET